MARYIDADKIECIKAPIAPLKKGDAISWQDIAFKSDIDNISTVDVQEVIYCRNCKNYCKFENGAVVCEEFGGYIKDTDFCSRGTEKKCGAKMDKE